jgi:di/tricarboxylate transporter
MQYVVLITIFILIILLAKSSIRSLYLFGGTLAFFYFLELISTENLLQNFVNEGLVTLVLLLLISTVLENTIFIRQNSGSLFSKNRYHFSLLKVTAITSFFSAFLNNTAVVAIMMSVIKRQKNEIPSKFLLPLSYAAILGGTVTLIGTSTNLIVNSFVISEGMPSLGMFDFAPIGIVLVLGGFVYMLLFSEKLLPKIVVDDTADKRSYFIEAKVGKSSTLIGKSVKENGFRNMRELFLAEIVRKDRLISPVTPSQIIEPDDILVFTGNVHDIGELQSFPGLSIFEEKSRVLNSNLVEVIVSHQSTLIGQKIKEAGFRSKFNASVVAVRRGSQPLKGKIGLIRIEAGDQLVLSVGQDFRTRGNIGNNFYLISNIDKNSFLSVKDSIIAISIFIGAILLSALGVISLFKAMLIVLIFYIVLKWTRLRQLKLYLPFELIIIIGSALGIAEVMSSSGAAMILVDFITLLFQDMGNYGYLIAIFLLTLILTEVITNNAAAALMFPIGYATAQSHGLDVMPFIMAVAYGASASFITPYSYQTNLMVYSAGRYRFTDYVKYGIPMSILYSIIVIVMLPIVFPFNG